MNLNMPSVLHAIVTIELEPHAGKPLDTAGVSSFFLDALGAVTGVNQPVSPEPAAPDAADFEVSSGTELPLIGNVSEISGNILPPPPRRLADREPAQNISLGIEQAEEPILPDTEPPMAEQTVAQAEPVLDGPVFAAPLLAVPLLDGASLAGPAEIRTIAKDLAQPPRPSHPLPSKLDSSPQPVNSPAAPSFPAPAPGLSVPLPVPVSVLLASDPFGQQRPTPTFGAKSVTLHHTGMFLPETAAGEAPSSRADMTPAGPRIEPTPIGTAPSKIVPDKDGSAPAPMLPTASALPALNNAPAAAHAPAPIPAVAPPQTVQPIADPSRPLETLIDNLVEARENGRLARGDMILRHAEFGAITLQLDRSDKDVRAFVSSRDPGFAPAAQAALADQLKVSVATDAAAQGRNADQSPAPGQYREGAMAQNGDRGGSRQSDPETRQPNRTDEPSREARPQNPEPKSARNHSEAAQRALYA